MAKRKADTLDADDVLAGRVKPSAAQLLELIHRENPTGRDFGAREAEIRYARKSRLQSLLVRRFADELEVAPDPDHPGTVSIRHRRHARDGCHAVLSALDEDARSWAQREIDLASFATPEPVPSARPSKRGAPAQAAPPRFTDEPDDTGTPEQLVARARDAIDAYDYELAQSALRRAIERSGGAAEPAAALLSLLVETLGDDAGALEIEGSLARSALQDDRVRGPLALAAARLGREDRALALMHGLDAAPAAAALSALATTLLASGEIDRAAAHAEQARRRDPTCPGLASVTAELAKARASQRAPMEAELSALLAAGDGAAEKKADEILSRWPESEAARRAKHVFEERRRAEREAREQRAREEIAAAQERHDAERVETTLRILSGTDQRAGLAAYASLERPLRARVRLRSARPELDWIDRMPAARAGAIADAVLAIRAARAALPGDPDAALSLLAPHAPLLDRVSEVDRITQEAQALQRERRIGRAREEVESARKDLAGGRPAEALARLGAAIRDLPKDEQPAAEALESEATRALERLRRIDEVAKRRREGRFFEARDIAGGLAEDAPEPGERARWEAVRAEIQQEIQREFQVEVHDSARSAEDIGRLRPLLLSECHSWLTADGSAIVVAYSFERWVIVRVLSLATMTVRPTVLVRTPSPMRSVESTVCGTTLWLVGAQAVLLALDMRTWDVLDYRGPESASLGDHVEIGRLVTAEDGRSPPFFWVNTRPREGHGVEKTRVIHLAQRRAVREIPDAWYLDVVASRGEPRVAARKGDSLTLHTARGTPSPPGRLDLQGPEGRLVPVVMASDPCGEGLVLLVDKPFLDDAGQFVPRPSIRMVRATPAGTLSGFLEIPDADGDRPAALSSASETGCIHALTWSEDGPVLTTAAARASEMEVLHRVTLSPGTVLIQDIGARRTGALCLHDGGVDAALLGPKPPALPRREEAPRTPIPNRYDVLACDRPSGMRNAEALALAASWSDRSHGEIVRQIRELERSKTTAPEQLVAVFFALRKNISSERSDEADRVFDHLALRFPEHPEVRLLRAGAHAREERWEEVTDCLSSLLPADFDEHRARHLCHLRALAAFRQGRFGDIEPEIEAAIDLEGDCALDSLTELTSYRGDLPGLLLRLIDAIREADKRFAAGDPAGALRVLDVPVVWHARELQSLARLVEARLAAPADTFEGRLHEIATLGALVDCFVSIRDQNLSNLPEAWEETRLADVEDRARARLAAFDATPPKSVTELF